MEINIVYVICLCVISFVIGDVFGFTIAINKCIKKLEE
jgi:hypothetical protein